jgi:hypothetical protein
MASQTSGLEGMGWDTEHRKQISHVNILKGVTVAAARISGCGTMGAQWLGHGDRGPHQTAHWIAPSEDPSCCLIQTHRHEGGVCPLPQSHHHQHPRFRSCLRYRELKLRLPHASHGCRWSVVWWYCVFLLHSKRGEPESTPDEIQSMVSPPHRLA